MPMSTRETALTPTQRDHDSLHGNLGVGNRLFQLVPHLVAQRLLVGDEVAVPSCSSRSTTTSNRTSPMLNFGDAGVVDDLLERDEALVDLRPMSTTTCLSVITLTTVPVTTRLFGGQRLGSVLPSAACSRSKLSRALAKSSSSEYSGSSCETEAGMGATVSAAWFIA